MARTHGPRSRPVPDGSRPGGDERFHLAAGRGLRHDGDHDPGSDRALRPGHGHADAHRRQARRPLGPAAGVPDRTRHLCDGLGPDRGLMERADAHPGLVGPRGNRGGPGDAGARRPGSGQLRGQGQGAGLRSARGCGRRRDRRRADPRRVGDDRAELARHLRRRGRGRGGDPARVTRAPRPRSGGPGAAAGLGRLGTHRPRPRADGLRRPSGEQLGLAAAAELSDRAVRVLAHPVRHRCRGPRDRGLRGVGAASRAAGPTTPCFTSACSASRRCAGAPRCCWPRT